MTTPPRPTNHGGGSISTGLEEKEANISTTETKDDGNDANTNEEEDVVNEQPADDDEAVVDIMSNLFIEEGGNDEEEEEEVDAVVTENEDNGGLHECVVCYERKPIEDFYDMECGHYLCKYCQQGGASGIVQRRCPYCMHRIHVPIQYPPRRINFQPARQTTTTGRELRNLFNLHPQHVDEFVQMYTQHLYINRNIKLFYCGSNYDNIFVNHIRERHPQIPISHFPIQERGNADLSGIVEADNTVNIFVNIPSVHQRIMFIKKFYAMHRKFALLLPIGGKLINQPAIRRVFRLYGVHICIIKGNTKFVRTDANSSEVYTAGAFAWFIWNGVSQPNNISIHYLN